MTMTEEIMRVRFAPSPTGPFHIGGARSALFNWLLARKYGGELILRVEDTDQGRSSRQSEENIKEALRWLGMDWDEGVDVGGPYGPYRQTERLAIYQKYTKQLLADGKAYHCYCSEADLETERQEQLAQGQTPRYAGHCRQLVSEEQAARESQGIKPVVRLRVTEHQEIVFSDMVRGVVSFESSGVGDFVIVKSDGMPVYNYAVVVDDALMHITHVIRAEEHLSNTPRQLLLYAALGFPVPQFGHISLILGQDRTKMSKRHGATSVEQYRNLGYLPEALVNYLALLGWAPGGEEELFTIQQLIEQFSMERVAKNPAVFDIDKLNWINSQYIRKISPEVLTELALPHLVAAGYVTEPLDAEQLAWLTQVVATLQEYVSYAAQMVEHASLFFQVDVVVADELMVQLQEETFPQVAALFREKLLALPAMEEQAIQQLLKSITKELKLGGKKVFMPIRIALTGQEHGPDLPKIILLLGQDRVLQRLENSLKLATAN
jgi:nondiscriminating glutamyl-tRNA synthetase